MEKTIDKVLELQSQDQLIRFYVPVAPGANEYFTREDLAGDFADKIGSTVKPLD